MVQTKWIALYNTTIGQLMATINTSIVIVALPPIFRGIQLDPLAQGSFPYLLWVIMSYMIVVSVLLLTIGKLSDMFGRVRLFNLGFLIFTVGSILLFLTPSKGYTGAIELIIFRVIQAVGGSFIMANSLAIITDNFDKNERGFAISVNSLASVIGISLGIVLGGIISIINWRYVFLLSVPFGVLGTVWSYLKLEETSQKKKVKIDLPGNIVFGLGLIILLIGITYGITPYKAQVMGWESPFVIASLIIGAILLIIFPFIEAKAESPMFNVQLYRNKNFSIGNLTAFISAMIMMGLMYLLTLLFQGIWLPLRGYVFSVTPLWAGIFMLPMTISMGVIGIIAGKISDKSGFRMLTTAGMLLSAVSLLLLTLLSTDFLYVDMGVLLTLFGAGYGLFNSPNISSVMSSVPEENRGTASGMINTMRNTGYTASLGLIFSILIYGISNTLPEQISAVFTALHSGSLIPYFIKLPPTEALFGAFLAVNPLIDLLKSVPLPVLSSVPANTVKNIISNGFFSTLFANPFFSSFDLVLYILSGITIFAGIISFFRDNKIKQ